MIVILDGILFCAFTSVGKFRVMDEKYQMGASWSMRAVSCEISSVSIWYKSFYTLRLPFPNLVFLATLVALFLLSLSQEHNEWLCQSLHSF